MAWLRLLSAQATGGFMRHVLARSASAAQQDRAQELLAASEQEAAELAAQIGDPDAISDKHGDLPAERRERHLDEHMTCFRRPLQREWSSGQQRRFRPLFRLWRSHKAHRSRPAPASWCVASRVTMAGTPPVKWSGRPQTMTAIAGTSSAG